MTPDRPRPSRSRRPGWRIGLGVAVLVLAGLWSAGWLLAARQAREGLDRWIAAEAAGGRQWTCPDPAVDGYPAAIVLRCTRPTFRGEIAGRGADGIVEGLTAQVGLDHPRTVEVDLRGPLNLRAEDDSFQLDCSWADLRVTVDAVLGDPGRGSLAAARLAVTLATPDDNLNLRAAQLLGEAHPAPEQPGGKAFSFAGTGLSLPTVDAIPGLDGPAAAAGQGVLLRADLLRAPTARRLDAWRQAGGLLRVDALRIEKGPFSGTATGTLGLDDAHRAEGRLDTALTGFGPIAQRFGIPVAGVQLGGLLTALLGGSKAATPAEPGAVRLPLVLANGRVAVGPFTTGLRLPPIY